MNYRPWTYMPYTMPQQQIMPEYDEAYNMMPMYHTTPMCICYITPMYSMMPMQRLPMPEARRKQK